VVRRAARKDVAIFQHRLKGRRVPHLQRIGRLYIVMAVNQHRALLRIVSRAPPDDWMVPGPHRLGIESDVSQLLNEPLRAAIQLLRIALVGRDARETEKRIEVVEIFLIHGLLPNDSCSRYQSSRVGSNPAAPASSIFASNVR